MTFSRRTAGFTYRAGLILLLALVATITPVLPVVPARRALASSEDLTTFIAREFPDRKTSSYDSQRLMSFLAGQLLPQAWTVEVKPYSVLVRAGAQRSQETTFIHVSGENLLAYKAPSSRGVDLLIVAPYDVLFREAVDQSAPPSYTARATAALLDFAAGLKSSGSISPMNVAVAFVSGHYQYGAGLEALLGELEKGSARVKAALVIGDIGALDSLPLTVGDNTPVALVRAVQDAARKNGLPVTVVGPRARDAWFRSALRPKGAYSVEFLLDDGNFTGEAETLARRSIPVLTLGLPRGGGVPACVETAEGRSAASATSQKTEKVAGALEDLLAAGESAQGLAAGRVISDTVVFQLAGRAHFVPRTAAAIASWLVAAVAVMALVVSLRSQRDFGPLALLGGILAVSVVSHGLRSLWFALDAGSYAVSLYPGRSVFLYFWSGLTFVLLGFLRAWRIRTRIAHLESRMSGRRGSRDPVPDGPASVHDASRSTHPGGSWTGSWGLALATAVLAGTNVLGSELAPAASLAALSLSVAVLLHSRSPGLWTRRFLCTVPLLPLIFWAGWPFGGDASRIYSASLATLSVESVSFTATLAVLAASLLSTFSFPAPASPRSLKAITVAELATACLFVVLGIAVPRSGTRSAPVVAVVKEFLGNEARLTVDAPRPVGEVALFPAPAGQAASNVPSSIPSRSISENVRFSTSPCPSSWASTRHEVQSQTKGEAKTRASARIVTALSQQPSFYQVRFQDSPYKGNTTAAFVLEDLSTVLGTGALPVKPDIEVKPAPGYSITVVWWMPKEPALITPFVISYDAAASRVDVVTRAVFLNRSNLGLEPSAANARFLLVTTVTQQDGYR